MRTTTSALHWLLILAFTLASCGGAEDTPSNTNRVIQNPVSQAPGGDEDPTNDPNQIDLSQHLSLGISQQMELDFPADHQGFCVEQNNNGTMTSNAQWTLGPTNVANVELIDANRCSPKVKLLNGYQESSLATITGVVPMPNNQVLSFVVRLHLRLAPAITQPTAAFDLNTNMPSYTGAESNTPPFSGGPNYNGDGPKMRFRSNGAQRWFRDGNKAANRQFGIPVALSDPSPFEPTTSDFTYTATCTSTAFLNTAGCENYCPFQVEILTLNAMKYAKFSFKGSTQAVQNSQGQTVQIFFLDNDQCIANNVGNTPINISLRATSPGGSTNKSVGTLTIEVDGGTPYF